MSVAAGIPDEVQSYLSSVREALADLPTEERDDLLAEVEASLADAASEGDRPLTARLGPPHEFAAELRSSAGLHAGTAPARSTRLADLVDDLRHNPNAQRAWELVTQLAPIWWVARGYLAVGLYAVLADLTWAVTYPVPRIGGSAEAGLGVILLAVVASVWLGLATRKASSTVRRLVVAGNVLLLVAVPFVLDRVQDRAAAAPVSVVVADVPNDLLFNGQRVENIYPYTREGKLLHDVLLYDAFGQPLTISGTDPLRRYLKTPGGRTIFNSFPIRHYEQGTTTVANPNAGPRVWLPKVVTPPLADRR